MYDSDNSYPYAFGHPIHMELNRLGLSNSGCHFQPWQPTQAPWVCCRHGWKCWARKSTRFKRNWTTGGIFCIVIVACIKNEYHATSSIFIMNMVRIDFGMWRHLQVPRCYLKFMVHLLGYMHMVMVPYYMPTLHAWYHIICQHYSGWHRPWKLPCHKCKPSTTPWRSCCPKPRWTRKIWISFLDGNWSSRSISPMPIHDSMLILNY